jgi:hypothetical protein
VQTEGLGKLEKFNDLIGTRTLDFPVCTIAPQPTAATTTIIIIIIIISITTTCPHHHHDLIHTFNIKNLFIMEALRYKPEGHGFETRLREWILSIYLILPVAIGPGVH